MILRKSNAFQPKIFSKNQTGKGIVLLSCSPNCVKICMGHRWSNHADLPSGFARLVAENKKCTGSTKASVGNQSNLSAAIMNNPRESEADR